MMKKILLAAVLVSMLAAAFPADASHQAITKNYIAGNGDAGYSCALEDDIDYCFGGAGFADLSGGSYAIEVVDDNGILPTSGGYIVDGGGVVDACFPATASNVLPQGSISVFIDGVVWWAIGQPCGPGQLSQGTTGTITVRHI